MLNPNFSPFPEIQTKRLVLCRMNKEDAKEIFRLRSSDEVMKYIDRERTKSINEAQVFISRNDAALESNNGIMWGICIERKTK